MTTIGPKHVVPTTAMAFSTAKSRTCLTLAKNVELIRMAKKKSQHISEKTQVASVLKSKMAILSLNEANASSSSYHTGKDLIAQHLCR